MLFLPNARRRESYKGNADGNSIVWGTSTGTVTFEATRLPVARDISTLASCRGSARFQPTGCSVSEGSWDWIDAQPNGGSNATSHMRQGSGRENPQAIAETVLTKSHPKLHKVFEPRRLALNPTKKPLALLDQRLSCLMWRIEDTSRTFCGRGPKFEPSILGLLSSFAQSLPNRVGLILNAIQSCTQDRTGVSDR